MKVIATTRTTQGTGASRRLRRADKLPGIIYGGKNPATPIELEHNPIFFALRKEKFHASILTMELDGKEELVVLRDFQMHPYKQQVMHIDFQRIAPDEVVTMRVPLHFSGEELSPAVKIDKCIISRATAYVEVACLPRDLPEFIAVDLSKMETGTTLHATDLVVPEGVKMVTDSVIASVIQPVEEEIIAPAAAEGDAAAAAPAAVPPPRLPPRPSNPSGYFCPLLELSWLQQIRRKPARLLTQADAGFLLIFRRLLTSKASVVAFSCECPIFCGHCHLLQSECTLQHA